MPPGKDVGRDPPGPADVTVDELAGAVRLGAEPLELGRIEQLGRDRSYAFSAGLLRRGLLLLLRGAGQESMVLAVLVQIGPYMVDNLLRLGVGIAPHTLERLEEGRGGVR